MSERETGGWIRFRLKGEDRIREGVIRRKLNDGSYAVDTDDAHLCVWPEQVLDD
ncbi:hypothetical protein [Actinomadura sp. K4S16]|uniref:hypothetical protein n=1 Tax=Actinomadura sp. K4S16 TaxID=1316147 RepID=UPI00135748FB|nr:hypothetical protein [Actinomadura sp. K4S16]